MIKAIIIDDEIDGIRVLQYLIADNCPDVEVVATESSPQKAIELIEKHNPDVVFLDIEMPGMSGFEMLENLRHMSFRVIFTTAYNNYAIRAFKYNTIDYLLKPIIARELADAVEKLRSRSESKSIDELLKLMKARQNPGKLAINSLSEILYIDLARVSRLESDTSYTHVIQTDGKKITSSRTLKEYETQLDSERFFRVHKAYIVNLDHVEKYVKSDGGYIVMADGAQIPVSREKRQVMIHLLGLR